MEFCFQLWEKHDIIVLPAGLVTVTYNCKNVIAPECEGFLQIIEMLLTNKVKKKMDGGKRRTKDGQSFSHVQLFLLPVNQTLICLQNKINIKANQF